MHHRRFARLGLYLTALVQLSLPTFVSAAEDGQAVFKYDSTWASEVVGAALFPSGVACAPRRYWCGRALTRACKEAMNTDEGHSAAAEGIQCERKYAFAQIGGVPEWVV